MGVVPFYMDKIRPVYSPPIPGISWFKELNFRTYVHDEKGNPGVWFFTLECNQWLAVKTARTLFHLPYHHATISASLNTQNDTIHYQSQRHQDDVNQVYAYPSHPKSPQTSEVGTLEFFLLERYRLFSAKRDGSLHSGLVHHQPYQYEHAQVEQYSTRLFSLCGFEEPTGPPVSSMIANRVKVDIHPLAKINI